MPPSHGTTQKRALARIQRLCCLGIPGEMLIPELIREIIEMIPSRNGVFYWLGQNFEIVNTYHTFAPAVMRLFYQEYYGTDAQTEVLKTYGILKSWTPSDVVLRLEQRLLVDRSVFLRSDFYNGLWRIAEIHDTLMLAVGSSGRLFGAIELCRGVDEPPFRPDEIAILGAIAGFVAHGMTGVTLTADVFADGDDRALFVVDSHGTVRHADGQARRLLTMALNPRLSAGADWRGMNGQVPELARLCLALMDVASGDPRQPPPVLRLRNPWGEFLLRAYWVGATDGIEQTRDIGVTIERRVPRALALRRRVEGLNLTAREKQLCLMLTHDVAVHDIADAMGLASSTVVTHQRGIYAKLGVHSRAGLLASLNA